MYNVEFRTNNGKSFLFGFENGVVADFNVGDSVPIDLGTSQGFEQVGETLERKSMKGRLIKVKGTIFSNIPQKKVMMRNILAPFVEGILIFNNKYEIKVAVKDAPTFSPIKTDGKFTLALFAPHPFFNEGRDRMVSLGTITPMFQFPINYEPPHTFGELSRAKAVNVLNEGNVKIRFELLASSDRPANTLVVTNLKTLEFLKINTSIGIGDSVRLYYENGILKCDKISDKVVTDIIDSIDETSNLYQLAVGDNLITATDSNGGEGLQAIFIYRNEVSAVYED